MPPRRARKVHTSSQPEAEERQLRSNRKRRLSGASQLADENGDIEEHETSSIASPSARKRIRKDTASQQTVKSKVPPATFSRIDAEIESQVHYDTEPDILPAQRGQHSQAVFDFEHDELAPSTGQLVRMPIKKRKTISPNNVIAKRLKKARNSLLTPEGSAVETRSEQLQFTPLRDMVDEYKRHNYRGSSVNEEVRASSIGIARKEERVRILIAELADIERDHETKEQSRMQEELEMLQTELAEVIQGDGSGRNTDSLLVLDNRNLDYLEDHASENNLEKDNTVQLRRSQNAASIAAWDAERVKLQSSVLALSQEVNDIKERWHLHEIALQSLGFTDDEATADEVVQAVRAAFDSLRTDLSVLLADTDTVTHGTNAAILEVVTSSLAAAYNHNTALIRQVEDRGKLVFELRSQINNLVARIANSESELERLTKQRTELLKHTDHMDSGIDHMQTQITELSDERDDLSEQLTELKSQHDQYQRTIQRHKEVLNRYRDEETRLQDLVARMEAEHLAKVKKMSYEREGAVRELNDDIDAEQTARAEAEAKLRGAMEDRSRLQSEVDIVAKERDSVLDKLRTMDEELQAEQIRREQAEMSSQMRTSEADVLEARVDTLEHQVTELTAHSETLKQHHLKEQTQRVRAEEELAELQATATDVESRRAQLGIEANRLRMKLHEIRQASAAELFALNADHEARCQQYQHASEAADVQRDELESALAILRDTLAGHEAQVVTMTQAIKETECQRKDEIEEHDNEIENFKTTIASYEAQLIELESAKASLESRVEAEAEQMLQTQADQQDELDGLRATVIEQHNKISIVEAKAKEADQRWQDLLNDREAELELAQTGFEQQAQANHDLTQELYHVQARFQAFVRNSRLRSRRISGAISIAEQTIREEMSQLDVEAHTETAAFSYHGDGSVAVNGLPQQRDSASNKTCGRHRNQDSAIGIESDELEADPIVAA